MKNEVWLDIKGYEKLYQISNFGRVKSLRKNVILKPGVNEKGYLVVVLAENQKRKRSSEVLLRASDCGCRTVQYAVLDIPH